MVGKAAFKQVYRTINHIRRTRKLEEQLGKHFGPTSNIAAQANMATREAVGVLIDIGEKFGEGLHLTQYQAYQLASIANGVNSGSRTDIAALGEYLSELTDGACRAQEWPGGCILGFHPNTLQPRI